MNIGRAVLIYLRAPGRWPTSSADIAMEINSSWARVRRALKRLQDDGYVGCRVTDGNDGWYVTQKGRDVNPDEVHLKKEKV